MLKWKSMRNSLMNPKTSTKSALKIILTRVEKVVEHLLISGKVSNPLSTVSSTQLASMSKLSKNSQRHQSIFPQI